MDHGSPWTHIGTGSELAGRIEELQDAIELQIKDYGNQPLPASLARWLNIPHIVRFWAENANGILNESPYGTALCDLLFVLICYSYAFKEKLLDKAAEMSTELDTYQTVCKLQRLATSLPDKDGLQFKQVFEECLALVLYKVQDESKEDTKKPRGFGMDYGDPQDEYTGDDEQQLQDLEEAKRKEDAAVKMRMAQAFLPWCSRTFFESWHAEMLRTEFKSLKELPDRLAQQMQSSQRKFDKWMEKQCAIPDLPQNFNRRLKNWTYRQLAGVGALRHLHRKPHMRSRKGDGEWTRLFMDDQMQTTHDYDKWLRKQKSTEINADAKHPLRDTLHLAMFATIFDCSYDRGDDAFVDNHVIFRDELLDKADKIREGTVALLPRPALIVQTGANRWQIHHEHTWYPAASMRDNLILWCLLMRDDRGACLLNGTSITEWIKVFV